MQPTLVTPTFRITWLHFTCGCSALIAAYPCKHYLQNPWTTLQLWVSNLTLSLCLLTVPSESLGSTTLIGVKAQVQRMIVRSTYIITGLHYTNGAPPKILRLFESSTYRITELHYTYGNATLSADYVGYLYFQNHCVTPYKWVFNSKDSLCWLALPRESLGYTTLIGVQPQVQPMIVRPTYRINRSHYTFGCSTYT